MPVLGAGSYGVVWSMLCPGQPDTVHKTFGKVTDLIDELDVAMYIATHAPDLGVSDGLILPLETQGPLKAQWPRLVQQLMSNDSTQLGAAWGTLLPHFVMFTGEQLWAHATAHGVMSAAIANHLQKAYVETPNHPPDNTPTSMEVPTWLLSTQVYALTFPYAGVPWMQWWAVHRHSLTLSEAFHRVRPVWRALLRLYALGLAHRDVRAANIVVHPASDQVCLVDVGGCERFERMGTTADTFEVNIKDPFFAWPPDLYVVQYYRLRGYWPVGLAAVYLGGAVGLHELVHQHRAQGAPQLRGMIRPEAYDAMIVKVSDAEPPRLRADCVDVYSLGLFMLGVFQTCGCPGDLPRDAVLALLQGMLQPDPALRTTLPVAYAAYDALLHS